ncbi:MULTISPECIES: subtilase family N-terminal domain-containing protein [Rikenellaceae]|uniref:subtilase family N-terminal domain-containing protein n=1 Tax=Rikenellaceae TaxID=171550 RepID=UPI0006894664|nr:MULTISPECIES: subtilase family N-terminal domain-containing protein [Rikenellaceae]
MKYRYWLAGLCAGLLISCAKESFTVGVEPEDGDRIYADGDEVIRGWIRIKLSEEGPEALRTGQFTRGEAATGDGDIDEVAAALGATEVRRVFRDGGRFAERRRRYGLHLWYDIRFDEEIPVSRAGAEFAALPGVAYAEPVYRIQRLDAAAIPAEALYEPPVPAAEEGQWPFDDPMLSQQWHYYNDGTISGTEAGADMNLFEGWKTTAGSPAVIVAVTDSGVQFDHEDLAANMWVNEAELNGTEGVDDDGNGYVDDIYGWNFVRDSGTIVPEDHGTHVAGTVAAVNNNGIGVCGVAGGTGNGDGARIMSMQIFEGDESVGDTNAECFVYAADNGAVISQNSWTWTRLSSLPRAYDEAFDYFIENAGMDDSDGDGVNDRQTGPMKGGIIICAAGNSGGRIEYPAADARCVAVTAMGATFKLEAYSNRGAEADIMAPGGVKAANSKRRVWSTVADNDYAAMYGTSMACPHVSGVAALIIAEYGQEGFTAEQCREILLRAYRPVGGLADDDAELGVLGVGLLDAGAAFVTDPQSQPGVVEFGSMQVSGNTVSVPWRVPADGNGNAVAQFVVEYAPKEGGGTPGGGTVANRYDVGQTMVYTFEGLYNTDYEINVRSIDRFGNSSEAVSGSVSIGNFENRPPERTSERMADVSMPDTAETSIVSITLTPYFTDPDLEYGDELSYSATSVNEDIVATEVAGEVLRLIPRAKGTSLVTVTASDLAGATVGFSIYATVAGGTGPSGDDGAVAISPNPVADRLNVRLGDTEGEAAVRIYDGAARLVMEAREEIVGGGVELDVSRLSPGAYSLVAEGGGRTVRGTFVKR